MAMTSNQVLVILLLGLLLNSAMNRANAAPICGIDTDKLKLCRAAVTGNSPPPPTKKCCKLIHQANLTCLCGFKSQLPALGINPAAAIALPEKCGLNAPPECHSP